MTRVVAIVFEVDDSAENMTDDELWESAEAFVSLNQDSDSPFTLNEILVEHIDTPVRLRTVSGWG